MVRGKLGACGRANFIIDGNSMEVDVSTNKYQREYLNFKAQYQESFEVITKEMVYEVFASEVRQESATLLIMRVSKKITCITCG